MRSYVERGMRILPESSWRPVLQRSIDAFYEGHKSEGIEACISLLQEPALPDNIRDLTYRNQTFYAQPLVEVVEGAQWEAPNLPVPEGSIVHGLSPVFVDDHPMALLRFSPGQPEHASTHALYTLNDDLGFTELAL